MARLRRAGLVQASTQVMSVLWSMGRQGLSLIVFRKICGASRSRCAVPCFCQQFDIERIAAFFGDRVNQGGDSGKVDHDRILCCGTKFAIKIPKVHAFWQWNASLPLNVFPDFVFNGFQHAVAVFAFDV
jgi:hypothetical protein